MAENLTADLIDSATYREAMSRVASTVHIVTTAGPAGTCGITASAMTSVSDHPPILLVCINHKSRANPAFRENGVFCVNTLGAEDEALSEAFAGRVGALSMPERFARASWLELKTGSPALEAARVSFDCRITQIVDAGSHSVLFGAVEAVRLGGLKPALVYLDRSYRSV